MAARSELPVSEVLFLFFTGRGGSFLSPKEKEKNGGAKRSGRERKEWVQKSASLGAEETGRSGRTGSSAPTNSILSFRGAEKKRERLYSLPLILVSSEITLLQQK